MTPKNKENQTGAEMSAHSKDDTVDTRLLTEAVQQIKQGLQSLENWSNNIENLTGKQARWIIHRCPTGRFLLDSQSLVDETIRKTDTWEGKQIGKLLELIKGNYAKNYDLVFLDIGAYLGWYSISMLKSGLFAEIHAFESNPENYAQLVANVLLNDAIKAIHTHGCVVTDTRGDTPISLPVRRANRGWAEAGLATGFNPDFHVPNIVLDRHFSDLADRFVVAKIDVEGSEGKVLDGMERLVRSNLVLLQIELYSRNQKILHRRLSSLGFKRLDSVQEDHFYFNGQ